MFLKRKSPTKFLEEEHPSIESEYLYMKTPGRLVDIKLSGTQSSVVTDLRKIFSMAHAGQLPRGFTSIHNHSSDSYTEYTNSLPSTGDLYTLFLEKYHTGTIIAQHNPETRKIEGYYFFRSSKRTPEFPKLSDKEALEINDLLAIIHNSQRNSAEQENEEVNRRLKQFKEKHKDVLGEFERDLAVYRCSRPSFLLDEGLDDGNERQLGALETFCDKYHLLFRIVPNKGYKFDRHIAKFVAETGLESKLGIITFIAAFILIITSFTSSITGFIVTTIPQNMYNLLSMIFLILGIVIISHVIHIR